MIMLHTHTHKHQQTIPHPHPSQTTTKLKKQKMFMHSVFNVVVPRAGFDCQYNGFSMLCSLTQGFLPFFSQTHNGALLLPLTLNGWTGLCAATKKSRKWVFMTFKLHKLSKPSCAALPKDVQTTLTKEILQTRNPAAGRFWNNSYYQQMKSSYWLLTRNGTDRLKLDVVTRHEAQRCHGLWKSLQV